MKATGIVRRIDDLGRVVIPKEIRRTMRIREGDSLEIYTDREGEVILKKYSPISELNEFAGGFAESTYSVLGGSVIVTDADQVIAVSGVPKKEYIDKRISPDLETVIHGKNTKVISTKEEAYRIIAEDDENEYYAQILVPIVFQGDAIGSVIFVSKEEGRVLGETELRAAEIGANLLARQMES